MLSTKSDKMSDDLNETLRNLNRPLSSGLKLPDFKTAQVDFSAIQNIKSIPQLNLASEFHKRLSEYIIEFEEELKTVEEVGLRLVSFGESITISVDTIGYNNSSLICFYGYSPVAKIINQSNRLI